jgi:hypothetical protein
MLNSPNNLTNPNINFKDNNNNYNNLSYLNITQNNLSNL